MGVVVGVDLAAQPKATGVVVLTPLDSPRWKASVPSHAATDSFLAAVGRDADVVGLDAPLGWPTDVVEAVSIHHRFGRWPGTDARRTLTHRLTDDVVRDLGWGQPLSASADKLGSTAMRAAVLQREWADHWGAPAPRDGSGRLVEVYPVAALRRWGLHEREYKGGTNVSKDQQRAARQRIFRGIENATASWLDLSEVESHCVESHDQLDALVSALVAVATRCGGTHQPSTVEERERASTEGWIHVPTIPLDGQCPVGWWGLR